MWNNIIYWRNIRNIFTDMNYLKVYMTFTAKNFMERIMHIRNTSVYINMSSMLYTSWDIHYFHYWFVPYMTIKTLKNTNIVNISWFCEIWSTNVFDCRHFDYSIWARISMLRMWLLQFVDSVYSRTLICKV